MRDDPNDALDAVAALVEEMRDILANGENDAPQAFLEAAHDAQDHINRAVLAALLPLLDRVQPSAPDLTGN